MTLQDTASRTALLLECARPFGPDVETHDAPGEAAIYGTGWHACLEALVLGRPLPKTAADEMVTHATLAFKALQTWMLNGNPFDARLRVESAEQHLASSVKFYRRRGMVVATRECGFDPEAHRYDLLPGEFGGTPDLVLVGPDCRVVLDYKSGDRGDFHSPSENPQLLTLALMTGADAVAILHHPRGGVPVIYSDPVSADALEAFARRRRKASVRIGDGSMRPHDECNRCPARDGCPAQDGELLVRASALVRTVAPGGVLAEPVDKGHFHALLQDLERTARRARELLREDVKRGEVIVRPDGMVLVIREKSYETLSKSSIIAALGKQRGEALIDSLRKQGCVTQGSREELHAVKEG